MRSFLFLLAVAQLALASPILEPRSTTPVVTITAPAATITGIAGTVEQFPGIPFALPPTGSLRLKPPQPITTAIGNYEATSNGPACPQFVFSDNAGLNGLIPTSEIGLLLDTPLFQTTLDESEDCLYLNVHRPAGVNSTSKLPVLFWIFGGGFELGWNSMYDGVPWVQESLDLDQPIIMVTVNYRVGGFGFLGGSEILSDGSANLGLLDQRVGLEWVADNIEAFGGDPTKVTIWGESAGSISVCDHMLAYNGDNTYNGQALFRGAMMNSGSIIPADPADCPKAQNVYDNVVSAAGCSSASDTLECLREADYQTFLSAVNSVPGLLGYQAVALAYLPRPDGTFLTESPEALVESGKFASVPFIIGDQEDEGTLFSLFESNITTNAELVEYFSFYYFNDATTEQIENLTTFYNTTTDGSPFRTGDLWNWYPQYKILAAILGDLTFTLTRRAFLEVTSSVHPDVPTWSYLSSYDYGTPILGTFHGSDILQVFFGILPNYASGAFHAYYINFVNSLDPNTGLSSTYATWPQWNTSGNPLLNMFPGYSQFIDDDFRSDAYNFVLDNVATFHI
jgi:triacylglycerol lipase